MHQAGQPPESCGPGSPLRTLSQEVWIAGKGIHQGREGRVCLKPSSEGRIVFRRRVGGRWRTVPVTLENVQGESRRTVLGKEARVETTEHFLAAFYAFGVGSVECDVEGPELPIGDGSAKFLCDLLLEAGLRDLLAPRPCIELREPLVLEEPACLMIALPAKALRITYLLLPPTSAFSAQKLVFDLSPASFYHEIAPARTFCTYEEVKKLRKAGLGQGGDTQNTLVLTRKGYYRPPRFADEPARHKILDLLGDLALLNAYLKAHLIAVGTGHAQNACLLKLLRRALASGKAVKDGG